MFGQVERIPNLDTLAIGYNGSKGFFVFFFILLFFNLSRMLSGERDRGRGREREKESRFDLDWTALEARE